MPAEQENCTELAGAAVCRWVRWQHCTCTSTCTCRYRLAGWGGPDKVEVCDVILTMDQDNTTHRSLQPGQIGSDSSNETPAGGFQLGSHRFTLLLYFCVRVFYSLSVNVTFNITDGAASTVAARQKSSYSLGTPDKEYLLAVF